MMYMFLLFFFFKQKTAYELRISDWSSDVCSSDLFGADYGAFAACRLLAGAGASPSPLLSAGLLDPDAAGCMTTPARAAMTAQLGPLAPLLVPRLDTLSTIRNAGDVVSRHFQKSTNWALLPHDILHVTDRLDVTDRKSTRLNSSH